MDSSNVLRSALEAGIEWNLRLDHAVDPTAYATVRDAFDTLWASTDGFATSYPRRGSAPLGERWRTAIVGDET